MAMADVERFFDKAISAFEEKMLKFFNERFQKLEEKLGRYDENIKDIEKSLNCCHERVASTEKKIVDIETTLNDSSLKSVQSELDDVKKVVFETQRQVNDLEQYGRRSDIRINIFKWVYEGPIRIFYFCYQIWNIYFIHISGFYKFSIFNFLNFCVIHHKNWEMVRYIFI